MTIPFFVTDLAVGSDWPGNPDASTIFPQTMQVDYVRVYRSSASKASNPELFPLVAKSIWAILGRNTGTSPYRVADHHDVRPQKNGIASGTLYWEWCFALFFLVPGLCLPGRHLLLNCHSHSCGSSAASLSRPGSARDPVRIRGVITMTCPL